jgi:hypothetical protein
VSDGKDIILDCEAEPVSVTESPLAIPSKGISKADRSHHTEQLRVVEVIAVDYIWREDQGGFAPVFGSTHGRELGSGRHWTEQQARDAHPKSYTERLLEQSSPGVTLPKAQPARLPAPKKRRPSAARWRPKDLH